MDEDLLHGGSPRNTDSSRDKQRAMCSDSAAQVGIRQNPPARELENSEVSSGPAKGSQLLAVSDLLTASNFTSRLTLVKCPVREGLRPCDSGERGHCGVAVHRLWDVRSDVSLPRDPSDQPSARAR
jgi:hypothetical protein